MEYRMNAFQNIIQLTVRGWLELIAIDRYIDSHRQCCDEHQPTTLYYPPRRGCMPTGAEMRKIERHLRSYGFTRTYWDTITGCVIAMK